MPTGDQGPACGADHAHRAAWGSDPSSRSLGLYVHVPFCRRKCRYCAFYSTCQLDRIDDFVSACRREIRMRLEPGRPVDTVYFGGGTPSLLRPGQVHLLLETIAGVGRLAPEAEITLEANPATAIAAGWRQYRSAGVNRITFGVQSFHDRVLARLGRLHTAGQAVAAFEAARRAGFDNLALDLIFGLHGFGLETWRRDLAAAVALGPDHLSCYLLTVEPGTALAAEARCGRAVLAPEPVLCAAFIEAHEVLTGRGFSHYEIANYARRTDGRDLRSRHNSRYWNAAPYLGVGPGAHSYDGRRRRWWNTADLEGYLWALDQGRLPPGRGEQLDDDQLLAERLLLGLRTDQGLCRSDLVRCFGKGVWEIIDGRMEAFAASGWAQQVGDRWCLTPQGMLRADGIAAHLCIAIG